MKIAEIEFDGGCTGNKGTYGFIVKVGKIEYEGSGKIERDGMSNNVAEYLGILKAIQRLKKMVPDLSNYEVIIYGDSRLVTETVAKRWGWSPNKVVWNPHKKTPHLKYMLDRVLEELEGVNYQTVWIRRGKNKRADALTRK